MTARLRRWFGGYGQHTPGMVRPLPDTTPMSDPWAAGEANCPLTDTQVFPAVTA